MDVRFSPNDGKTTLSFLPKETDRLSVLMQLVIEEEKKRGMQVPDFGKDFFKSFATSKDKFVIEFDFSLLPFTIVYLDEVIEEMLEYGSDPTELDGFVEQINSFCSQGQQLQ